MLMSAYNLPSASRSKYAGCGGGNAPGYARSVPARARQRSSSDASRAVARVRAVEHPSSRGCRTGQAARLRRGATSARPYRLSHRRRRQQRRKRGRARWRRTRDFPHSSAWRDVLRDPSNRLLGPSTSRSIRAASVHFPCSEQLRQIGHTRQHIRMLLSLYPPSHAKYLAIDRPDCAPPQAARCSPPPGHTPATTTPSRGPVSVAPVKVCSHVWHSHHTLTPRRACCDTASSIRESMCAGPLSHRHAQSTGSAAGGGRG
jgi:hypothetical protein